MLGSFPAGGYWNPPFWGGFAVRTREEVVSLMAKKQRRRRRSGVCAVLLVGLAGGCGTDLATIDRELRELAAERTGAFGGTASPSREAADPETLRAPGQSEPAPGTTNPRASQIEYRVAVADRDVAGRLERYGVESLRAQGALELDLGGVLKQAQRTSREYLTREEDYLVAAIGLLIERHQWSPRLFNDTTVGMDGEGTQGRFENAWSVINTLRATKRLPFGGEVEARWVTNWSEQLRRQVSGRYQQSSEVALRATLPLLRGSGEAAREGLIQAERDLVYEARRFERFRRELLVSIATDYFGLLQFRAQIANQERQLDSLRVFAEGTAARVEAGRVREFEKAIADNQVLIATRRLADLREAYILAVDRFKVRLGLPVDTGLDVKPFELELPEPDASLADASRLALEYRLDLQNERDRVDDARRAVSVAKNQLLPDLDLSGSVGVPTSSNDGVEGVYFDPEDLNYSATLTLSLPLDRRREGLALRQQMIRLEQSHRNYERSRDNVVVEVRSKLRNVDLARFKLVLAERAVEINRRRVEEQQLNIDQVEPREVVNTQNDLLDSENDRDDAVRELRVAVLEYLLASDQLRVDGDGGLERLGTKPDSGTAEAP